MRPYLFPRTVLIIKGVPVPAVEQNRVKQDVRQVFSCRLNTFAHLFNVIFSCVSLLVRTVLGHRNNITLLQVVTLSTHYSAERHLEFTLLTQLSLLA